MIAICNAILLGKWVFSFVIGACIFGRERKPAKKSREKGMGRCF